MWCPYKIKAWAWIERANVWGEGGNNKTWFNWVTTTLVYIQQRLSQWNGYWIHATQPQKPLKTHANFKKKSLEFQLSSSKEFQNNRLYPQQPKNLHRVPQNSFLRLSIQMILKYSKIPIFWKHSSYSRVRNNRPPRLLIFRFFST